MAEALTFYTNPMSREFLSGRDAYRRGKDIDGKLIAELQAATT